jgi:hypothetical protein
MITFEPGYDPDDFDPEDIFPGWRRGFLVL